MSTYSHIFVTPAHPDNSTNDSTWKLSDNHFFLEYLWKEQKKLSAVSDNIK